MLDERAQAHLAHGKDRIISRFWELRNIVSVGVSTRERAGERTDEPAIRVGVAKKRKPGYLRASDMLPDRIDVDGLSYKVDVVETGEMFSKEEKEFQPPSWTYNDRQRNPLRPGVSITNASNGEHGIYDSGTLGCFVRDPYNQICILSNRHVLVNLKERNPNNNVITQPLPKPYGDKNIVATLATDIPWKRGVHAKNLCDAAYARLHDQSEEGYTQTPIHPRMTAPSPEHKAVGLFFAGNKHHSYGYICKIHYVLEGLQLSMLTPGSACAAGEYRFLANIHKVGARSGYSSTRIEDLSATVKVNMSGKRYNFTDVLGTGRMGWPGDSGSLVCYGGTGADWVPLENPDAGDCSIWASVGKMYNLPLQGDIPLADRLRDEFLSKTTLGNFLIEVFYLNAEAIVARTEAARTSPYEKAAARAMYDKYRTFMESALNNPADPGFVVRQEHLDDTNQLINGISAHLRAEEAQALRAIYERTVKPTLGMTHGNLLDYLNNRAVFDAVSDQLARVPTITTQGVVTGN
ncbi:hypothetical protein [Amycolatopsis sp. NPDC059021]|uniref:hypothetical protein n=1 Tax=Amycolatopsis sp. NPDC059021 TaxID=3346704 RepID=UPI003670BC81